MPPSCYLRGELISPIWSPCYQSLVIALIFHVPLPASALPTFAGGSISSQPTPLQDQSSHLALLMIQMLSQM